MILDRLADSRFSTVRRALVGGTAILLGGGPSLSLELFERARAAHGGNVRAIAINDAYLLAPWAEVLYAADQHWWKWHSEGVDKPWMGLTSSRVREKFDAFAGQRCSIWNTSHPLPDGDVHFLKNYHGDTNGHGLSDDPEKLVTGWNGGWQALNLAILAGARKIILLGFDGRCAADGTQHWHGGHPKRTPDAAYEHYRRAFSAGEAAIEAAGVRVFNCSPGSAIDSFPKMALEAALTA